MSIMLTNLLIPPQEIKAITGLPLVKYYLGGESLSALRCVCVLLVGVYEEKQHFLGLNISVLFLDLH